MSTGDVLVMERSGSDGLHQQLAQLEASELLWAGDGDSSESARPAAWCPDRLRLSPMGTPFSAPGRANPPGTYKLSSLGGLGLPELPLALRAFGGLLRYVNDTQPLEEDARVPLDVPAIVHSGETLVLDAQTRRNLELTATQRDGQLQGSLLWAIDQTLTAMGGRCPAPLAGGAADGPHRHQQRQAVVSLLVISAPAPGAAPAAAPHGRSRTPGGPGRCRPCRCPRSGGHRRWTRAAPPTGLPPAKRPGAVAEQAHGPAATGARPG